MMTLSESTIACSRRTTAVSRSAAGSYSASATSDGSAGRGVTHNRPSPTCGGVTMCGPTASGLVASIVSGRPTGAGTGGDVSGTAALGSGRPSPPLGPMPRRVPPNGGSSWYSGVRGGMMVINRWCRSICHDDVIASTTTVPCTTALTTQVSRRTVRGGLRISNSGEHLSQSLGGLDQPRRTDREGDPEKPFPTRAESAPGKRHHARFRECPARDRRRFDALGERHPKVHRRRGRLGLEPLRAQHREDSVTPLLEALDVPPREGLG